MKYLITLFILVYGAGLVFGQDTPAETDSKETKLLLGFEMDEYKKIAHPHIRKGKPKWRVKGGYPYYLYPPNETESSQGKYSRCKTFKRGVGYKPKESRLSVERRGITILRTSGWHHLCFGNDWSEYPKLRMDVKATAEAKISIEVEDRICSTPLIRNFDIQKDTWTTLEFNIEDAEKQGFLDRKQIVSMYISCEKTGKGSSVYLDNIRLTAASVKPKLDLVKDTSAWPVLLEPASKEGKTTRPEKPAKPSIKPDYSPVPKDEKPVSITGKGPAWGNTLHKVARGIGAFDSKYLSSIFMAPTGSMRVSNDGGRTWQGLKGKEYTIIAKGNNTPNRHGFFCYPAEALNIYLTHCAGGGSPSITYFNRVFFDGTKWNTGPAYVVDRDVRHCPERYDVIRLRNGRLWGAWDHYDRAGRIPIAAKFSDDGGKTWQHGGKNGIISKALRLGSLPFLAAYGEDGILCAFRARGTKKTYFTLFIQEEFDKLYEEYLKQDEDKKIPWDRFTGNRSAWKEPTLLTKADSVGSVLGLAEGRVFASVNKPSAVWVWDGKTWKESLKDASGLLSQCGDKVVLVSKSSSGTEIEYRIFDGTSWSGPEKAASEEGKVKSVAVPRVAPPNFVPLAWSNGKDKNEIKTLRVSIPEKR